MELATLKVPERPRTSLWLRQIKFIQISYLGIQDKLDYFESLNIGSLWLTPIYPSPMKDNGYDVKDYMNVDEKFGNLEDFKVNDAWKYKI